MPRKYNNFKKSYKIIFVIGKIMGFFPISFDNGDESFWDYFWGLPMIVFIYYCIVINRLHSEVYYSYFYAEAAILTDTVLLYSNLIQFNLLVIYNFLVRDKIKCILDILDCINSEIFNLQIIRFNFNFDLILFGVLYSGLTLLDLFSLYKLIPSITLLDYCGYILPYFINIFYILTSYEILYVSKKLFEQINTYLFYYNNRILNIGSLILLSKNHLVLMNLVNEKNNVFGFAILTFSANLFVWIVYYIFSSIVRSILHYNSTLDLVYTISMLSWAVFNKLVFLYLCYGWVSLSKEVSNFVFSSLAFKHIEYPMCKMKLKLTFIRLVLI